MERPTYNKRVSYKTLQELFISKYPEGSIWQDKQDYTGSKKQYTYKLCFIASGKVYTYKPLNNTALIIQLDLSQEIKDDYNKHLQALKDYEAQPIPKHDTLFGLW